jgi:nitrite reductase/ring-hydroxylating ferredoxin subunit
VTLHRIAALDELSAGKLLERTVAGHEIVLCRHSGRVHAFQGNCPHRNAPLGHGNLVDGCIVCPWHGWEFDVERGALDYNPAIRLRRYAVVVRDGSLWIELDGADAPG